MCAGFECDSVFMSSLFLFRDRFFLKTVIDICHLALPFLNAPLVHTDNYVDDTAKEGWWGLKGSH